MLNSRAESTTNLAYNRFLKLEKFRDQSPWSVFSISWALTPISGKGKGKGFIAVDKPISYATYRESFERFFKDIVLDISKYSTHSIGAGRATLAANAGVPVRRL